MKGLQTARYKAGEPIGQFVCKWVFLGTGPVDVGGPQLETERKSDGGG